MFGLFASTRPRGPRPTILRIDHPRPEALDEVGQWIAKRGKYPLLVNDRYWVAARSNDAFRLFALLERGGPGIDDLCAEVSGKIADAIAIAGEDGKPAGRFPSDSLMLFTLAAKMEGATSILDAPFGTATYDVDAPKRPSFTRAPE
jgi:hypothetical protein